MIRPLVLAAALVLTAAQAGAVVPRPGPGDPRILVVDFDPTEVVELRSALGNLISNAVRYTPHGGEILVRWEDRGEEVGFSVKDSGIGIEPIHIPRLTERFYRIDRSRSRETGGTGLGLSIVKHVLTRHQARLEIESEVGQGSTFSVVFPATRVLRNSAAVAALAG